MNCSISLNQPLELLLGDFSTRSGNMDIASFSEVFHLQNAVVEIL